MLDDALGYTSACHLEIWMLEGPVVQVESCTGGWSFCDPLFQFIDLEVDSSLVPFVNDELLDHTQVGNVLDGSATG